MRVLYIGNFVPSHSTENCVRRAFETLGWQVDPLQEQTYLSMMRRNTRWRELLRRAQRADLVLHTLTQGAIPEGRYPLLLWQECARAGVPTASIHLDRFYGLASSKKAGPQRYDLPRTHPMFRVAHVFTADGAHDDDFARDGVNHHWLPPGVSHTEAVDWPSADAVIDYESLPFTVAHAIAEPGHYLVGFAGSDDYHAEWPHRAQLVTWLRETYKDRFLHIGGTSTPRINHFALNRILASVPVWVGDSCLTHPGDRYWSDRVPETWGRGGFLIHPRVDALNEHYEHPHPGADWECGDWTALRDEIDLWLDASDRVRDECREVYAAHTRANDTYLNRVQTMLDTIGITEPQGATDGPRDRP